MARSSSSREVLRLAKEIRAFGHGILARERVDADERVAVADHPLEPRHVDGECALVDLELNLGGVGEDPEEVAIDRRRLVAVAQERLERENVILRSRHGNSGPG
jgi:hypothetical protein